MAAAAPARSSPRRSASPGGHLIPVAVGRTAVAVRQLPDSGAIKHLTRGRAWIAVLGVLLIGIVALNVATLSLTATAGKVEDNIQTLSQENSVLRAHQARLLANSRVRSAAASIGLATPAPGDITYRDAGRDAIAAAARRLSAISG
jgi:cell division protein FtsL